MHPYFSIHHRGPLDAHKALSWKLTDCIRSVSVSGKLC